MVDTVDSVTTLPPVQRYIVKHNAEGQSVHADSPPQRFFPYPGAGGFARSYSTALPAKLEGDADMKAYLDEGTANSWDSPIIVAPGGASVLVVDLLPGGTTLMHRTVSIDYTVVVVGEVEHELDSGEVVRLKPGVCTPRHCSESYANLHERTISSNEGQIICGVMSLRPSLLDFWALPSRSSPLRSTARC